MTDDPIVEEIRRYRQQHAEQFGHDLKRIVDDLRKKEDLSERPRLNPGPKRIGNADDQTRHGPDYEVIRVDKIVIPSREERNARR